MIRVIFYLLLLFIFCELEQVFAKTNSVNIVEMMSNDVSSYEEDGDIPLGTVIAVDKEYAKSLDINEWLEIAVAKGGYERTDINQIPSTSALYKKLAEEGGRTSFGGFTGLITGFDPNHKWFNKSGQRVKPVLPRLSGSITGGFGFLEDVPDPSYKYYSANSTSSARYPGYMNDDVQKNLIPHKNGYLLMNNAWKYAFVSNKDSVEKTLYVEKGGYATSPSYTYDIDYINSNKNNLTSNMGFIIHSSLGAATTNIKSVNRLGMLPDSELVHFFIKIN